MSNVARLFFGASHPLSVPHDQLPLVLLSAWNIPLLWEAGFAATDLRIVSANENLFLESTAGEMHRRLTALGRCLPDSHWLSEVWSGLDVMTSLLDRLPKDVPAILDANEVAAMYEPGAFEAASLYRIETFAKLRERWDAQLACQMMRAERPDILHGNLHADGKRARRATRTESDRAAFFELTFGHAVGVRKSEIEQWLARAPRADALRPAEEEAQVLARTLLSRDVIRVADADLPATLPFFSIATQLRSVDGLQEILQALFAQHLVRLGSARPREWRRLDRSVGPDQPDKVPVFDRELLTSAIEALGD